MTMGDNKKRKKLSFTESTGGDHAASVHSAGPTIKDEIEVLPSTTLISENIFCPVCKGNFSSMSAYNSHSCH